MIVSNARMGQFKFQMGGSCPQWTSLVTQMVKNLLEMWETRMQFLGQEDPLERSMATHSSIFAWRIPWTEEPGRLQSRGSQRITHDWATDTFTYKDSIEWLRVVCGNQSSDQHISAFAINLASFLSSPHRPPFCPHPEPSQRWDQSVSPKPLQTQQQVPVSRFNEENPSQEGWGQGFMEALGQMA